MNLNILPIPYSDDSNEYDPSQSQFYIKYGIYSWEVKFEEKNNNFISVVIECQSVNENSNLVISLPFKMIIKYENDIQHIIINTLSFDTFVEMIPFLYEPKQIIQVEANIMPFIPVKCSKNYDCLYYSAHCCYFMAKYDDMNDVFLEAKNYDMKGEKMLITKQEILQANDILRSLSYQPTPIDQFTFYLNNFSLNDENPLPSGYDFSIIDNSPPTIQETISNIIFNYFSRILNIKLDLFDTVEENSRNLSYLSKISNDSLGLVFLNPSSYIFDENYQITNKNNKMSYTLYSMISFEGRNYCSYFYSFNLKSGFKFSEGDCIVFERDRWPHQTSIITIFIRTDVIEKIIKQNNFIVYKANLDQVVTVYQYDFRFVEYPNGNYIKQLIDELRNKNERKWSFGSIKTTRFSVLSKQDALLFRYDPIENIFPSFPSIDFDDSCLLITFYSKKIREFVYQLIWFQKVTEQFNEDYFLDTKNDIKSRINPPESVFLPSVQFIKNNTNLANLFDLAQAINKSPNKTNYWQIAAVKNHCIHFLPQKREDFNIDLLKFSLVFFACGNPQSAIPIAIRFGRYDKANVAKVNQNISDDINDDVSNSSASNDLSISDNYDDNGKLIFYGTPKLVFKKESDFPSFIQLVQNSFENFTILYRYKDQKKNRKCIFNWKPISDSINDLVTLKNDVSDKPISRQIYHLMLIEKK